MRSNTYIFGGPIPPPYLAAASKVIDLLTSEAYPLLRTKLDRNIRHMVGGLTNLNLIVLGGLSPIISVLVGDEEATFKAGKFLFDEGFYVQSVTFPAVPYHAGILRIQVNSNHLAESIEGLLTAMSKLTLHIQMPRTS